MPAAKTRKKSNHRISNPKWTAMMAVIVLMMVAWLGGMYVVHLQLAASMQDIDVEIAEAKAENAALQKQYDNQDSPEFIEKVAREKLNMVYPSELVYINANSEEGKKLLNSIRRSAAKVSESSIANSNSTKVE